MKKRPICMMCLFFVCAILLTDGWGISLFRGNPLSKSVQTWIRTHSESIVCGEVQSCSSTQTSQILFLKNTFLFFTSEKTKLSEQISKVSLGNLKVSIKTNTKLPLGSIVVLSGNLQEIEQARNPGEFDAEKYYACRHIYYQMENAKVLQTEPAELPLRQFLEGIRSSLSAILESSAGTDAPVFQAMLLGDKTNLDQEVKTLYQIAGIVHILAISGMHISILGMGFYKLLLKVGFRLKTAAIASLGVMLLYGMMIGGSVSTMRSLSMFFLLMAGKISGRTYDMLTGLSLSAILLLLESPAYLYDSGFLLSFGTVIGIGVIKPEILKNLHIQGKIKTLLLSSAAVQMTTLPLVLYAYGEVSLAGIFLNLLVLPTVGCVLVSGVAACVLGTVSKGAAGIVIFPGRCLLKLYHLLCMGAGKIPFCTWIAGRPKLWQCGLYYVLLFLFLAAGKKWFKKDTAEDVLRMRILACFLLFLGLGVLNWKEHGFLKICCLDVGQGDAILIHTPGDTHFLVDGGSSNKFGIAQNQLLPYLKSQGISVLDGIIVSHTDADHISGVKELFQEMAKHLTSIRVSYLFLPELQEEPENYKELEKLAQKAGVSVKKVKAKDVMHSGEVCFRFLHPQAQTNTLDINEACLVFELQYGKFRGLFMGDAGMETEKVLLPNLNNVDFLKVGHHGSAFSSGEAFLTMADPEIGVISCSESNTYGHPAKAAVERLQAAGCHLEYTMKSGAVTILTDGKKIKTERFVAS